MRSLLLALILLGSGCVALDTGFDCTQGQGAYFVIQHHRGGFVPQDLADHHTRSVLGHDRVMVSWGAHERAGTGRVTGPDADLDGLTLAQLTDVMKKAGAWNAATDYEVTKGWRGSLTAAEFQRACDSAKKEVFTPQPDSGREVGCADGGTNTFRLSTSGGDRTAEWRCGGPAQEANEFEAMGRFQGVYSAAHEAARQRVPGAG